MIKVLDCTFRDGGYYNHWDFGSEIVDRYLKAIFESGIEIVEIGLRSFPRRGFHGPFAYCTEHFINQIAFPEGLKLAVMVDAKTILDSSEPIEAAVDELFLPAAQSRVEIVRIATHFSQVAESVPIAKKLKSLGYFVGFNLMQSGGKTSEQLETAARLVSESQAVDVLYFADSMGNMGCDDLQMIVKALKRGWIGDLGFHSHNNMGRANQNCIEAIKLGVTWIDVTVTGMGRGAGNAQSEILLNELAYSSLAPYKAEPLYELALDYFGPLQKQKGWGANFAYHFSAIHGIHPSYAQELLGDSRYSAADVVSALNFLSQSDSASFDMDRVQQALSESDDRTLEGTWNAKDWCSGEDIFLIGAGPSVAKYSGAISNFIESRKIRALSLNFNSVIDPEHLSAYVAADSKRLTLDAKRYCEKNYTMISPMRHMSPELKRQLESLDVRDYDLRVTAGEFKAFETGCHIPRRLSFAYALAICVIGGARRVFMAGFDGYTADDSRQFEMVETLETIKKSVGNDFMIALTPTTYPINQGSVFAPYAK